MAMINNNRPIFRGGHHHEGFFTLKNITGLELITDARKTYLIGPTVNPYHDQYDEGLKIVLLHEYGSDINYSLIPQGNLISFPWFFMLTRLLFCLFFGPLVAVWKDVRAEQRRTEVVIRPEEELIDWITEPHVVIGARAVEAARKAGVPLVGFERRG